MGASILGGHPQVGLVIADRRLKTLFVLGLAGPFQHESHLAMKLEGVQEVNRHSQQDESNQAGQQEAEIDWVFHD